MNNKDIIRENMSKDVDMVNFLKENITVKGYIFIVFGENAEDNEDFIALYDFHDPMKAMGGIEVTKAMIVDGIKDRQKDALKGPNDDSRGD